MQYQIHIEDPCNESWENMTPNGNGRHCDSCCKTVVDFTEWSLEDIAAYLREKGKGNVCGHLRASQLNRPFETPEALAEKVWQAAIPVYRKIAAVIILFFAVTISACSNNTTGEPTSTAQQMHVMGDTTIAAPPPAADTPKIHFDGNLSIKPFPSNEVSGDDSAKHATKTSPKHKHKAQQTSEPVDVEPEVQGAVQMVPLDTNWRQHIPVVKPDSTNRERR